MSASAGIWTRVPRSKGSYAIQWATPLLIENQQKLASYNNFCFGPFLTKNFQKGNGQNRYIFELLTLKRSVRLFHWKQWRLHISVNSWFFNFIHHSPTSSLMKWWAMKYVEEWWISDYSWWDEWKNDVQWMMLFVWAFTRQSDATFLPDPDGWMSAYVCDEARHMRPYASGWVKGQLLRPRRLSRGQLLQLQHAFLLLSHRHLQLRGHTQV